MTIYTHYTVPHIQGLLVLPWLVADHARLLQHVDTRFPTHMNQAMVFGQLPCFLADVVARVAAYLPDALLDQLIVNRYASGEGIGLHVDLLRFEDGIVVVSLQSELVMDFVRCVSRGTDNGGNGYNRSIDNGSIDNGGIDNDGIDNSTIHNNPTNNSTTNNPHNANMDFANLKELLQIGPLDTVLLQPGDYVPFVHLSINHTQLHLPPGSVVILRDDARFHWQHGIQSRSKDPWYRVSEDAAESVDWDGVLNGRLETITIPRLPRTSLTLRRLKRDS